MVEVQLAEISWECDGWAGGCRGAVAGVEEGARESPRPLQVLASALMRFMRAWGGWEKPQGSADSALRYRVDRSSVSGAIVRIVWT
jgi:hypothetical protein